ncbi:MAG TPA: F0F1 ATP synthase subunit A [Cyclobacteriaceae bacterium]|nr:F0F1 ATP synthase subunit A [Cyclobacteriaceae bacterium]MCB9237998.1 F0F1 ATP synthase subunit A [Flammeovirgaceae bacterium]MCB0499162.1 F0F1 ATP synthase subunit A [Cyclobacteriaceae bacterium]MCO5272906.1 F0F1 ATP synthase subunit A [Cyclobacteriaceae bacterium]MCW5901678.1 F0F1 ATP synthase subunit A [Cyclobacteriaceae bacterium]
MTAFPNKNDLLRIFFIILLFIGGPAPSHAAENAGEEGFNVSEVIIHHVLDDHVWHLFDGHYGTLYLPVIVYSGERGLEVFSSSNFYDEAHNLVTYKGYRIEHGHIYLGDTAVLDFSITKNVAMLLLTAIVVLLVFGAAARGAKKNSGKAPRGIQSFLEPVILFVTEEIIKPNAGPKASRYTPYLLTLFFFILFGNLLGLLPGAGNLTGNIAVTMTLAVFTFLITNFSGNKGYWAHVFWTPGVPLVLRPILLLVEVIGLFTKPFALLIRLFAAITAGHIVLLSIISLTFIFQSWLVGFASTVLVVFISLIELVVAGIQAYVFTLFSSLYIGLATAENEHH